MPTTITSAGITFNDTTSLTSATIGTSNIANNAVTAAKLGTTEQKQICKAWVQFNGSGTVIGSYGVSSVTKNSGGNFTVNLSTALSDANYSLAFGFSYYPSGGYSAGYAAECVPLTASTFGVYYYPAGTTAIFSAQVFGN